MELMLKLVLITIRKEKEEGGYDINAHTLIGALIPEDLRGPPSAKRYTSEDLEKSVMEPDIKYETIKKGQSIYTLQDGTRIIIDVIISQIMKTDKYTIRGEPIYIVRSTPSAKIIPLWKRSENKAGGGYPK
jgi:hypothetical protein